MNSLSKRDVLFILDKKLCLPVLLSSNLYFPINEKKYNLIVIFVKFQIHLSQNLMRMKNMHKREISFNAAINNGKINIKPCKIIFNNCWAFDTI